MMGLIWIRHSPNVTDLFNPPFSLEQTTNETITGANTVPAGFTHEDSFGVALAA